MNILNNEFIMLDDLKKKCIESDNSYIVQGSAGCGKSSLIVGKAAYLMKEKQVEPKRIMIFTLEKNNVALLKDKLNKLGCDECEVFDIHQYAYKILNFFYTKKQTVLGKVHRDLSVFVQKAIRDLYKVNVRISDAQELLKMINSVRNELIDEKSREKKMRNLDARFDLFEVFKVYEQLKSRKNVLDYEDLLAKATMVLQYDKQYYEVIANQYDYVLVDDVQESNELVYRFLCLLLEGKKQILICGSRMPIYTHRCPKKDILECLQQKYSLTPINLVDNYRNNRTIFESANQFISKKIIQPQCQSDETCELKFKRFADLNKMYDYAIKKVEEDDLSTAFLYRNPAMAIPMIDLLEEKQIKYSYKGNVATFLQDKVVKDLSTLIKLILNPYDVEAFSAIHQFFQLEIPKRVLSEISLMVSEEANLDVYHAILESSYRQASKYKVIALSNSMMQASRLNTLGICIYFLDKMGYREYANDKGILKNESVILAYMTLAQRYEDPKTFLEHLANFECVQDSDDRILLSTIDDAYGIEYDRVCILDCMKTLFPLNAFDEKERRKFYYAITRAKKELEFFTAKKQGVRKLDVSSYLYEIHEARSRDQKNVESDNASTTKKAKLSSLKRGVIIIHPQFGEGKITKMDNEMMHVSFGDEIKVMNAKLCIKNSLITLK